MNTNNRHREFLRIADIVRPHGLLPIGKSTWWQGVRSGRYPKPVKLGPGITAWRTSDIAALIKNVSAEKTDLPKL